MRPANKKYPASHYLCECGNKASTFASGGYAVCARCIQLEKVHHWVRKAPNCKPRHAPDEVFICHLAFQ